MTSWNKTRAGHTAAIFLISLLTWQAASAGLLRDHIKERRAMQEQSEELDDEAEDSGSAPSPAGARVMRDVAYGNDARQRFDVYLPAQAKEAPVIFMVHGGGWKRGDKAMRSVVDNKVARWVPAGFIVISVNYRLLPDAEPIEQARDVARALTAAQRQVSSWGGAPGKFILIGHSAGAHLVSLLAASPAMYAESGAMRWLGTVSLDSAAFDVAQVMQGRHLRLYDRAFGRDEAYWKAASPFHALTVAGSPFLAVCSTRRSDSCPQADAFVTKASSLGMRASVLKEDLSHREINQRLGEAGNYTQAVEAFMRGLDPQVAARLGG
ncbi:MAG TPA: alpha/beta hydrolase [Noviherbaspirillum sp.]